MALVTVQRSPSVAGSPQCSNSDNEAEDDEGSKNEKSECFFAGKGTALVLALNDIPQYSERRLSTDSIRSTNSTQSNNSDIQQHLQSMFYLIRHEETLKMAVKLESQRANRTRYLVIASRCCYRPGINEKRNRIMRHNSARMNVSSTTGTRLAATFTANRQLSVDSCKSSMQQSKHIEESLINRHSAKCDVTENLYASGDSAKLVQAPTVNSTLTFSSPTSSSSEECEGIEESCLLGIDCNERTTVGLVVPILADTTIHLDGDGGFSVSVYGKTHIFKPVSVQAMWSALQTLHKVSQKARENNFYPGGPSHDWLTYYEKRIESDQSCLNEWNAMDSLESRRPPSPDAIRNKPTAKEETESVIKMKLKEIMMSVDLDEVTSKYIRSRLEEHLDMDLGEYKSFIDEEMLIILGQMDAPTEIFEHVYLGSEWNASNLEELQKNGVRHILNVTREIDNFFPGMFDYLNVRVYDDEKTNLLKYWDNTYRYITRAKAEGSKVLVHCKMGVSRSASVVIAYAMKAYNWEFQKALQHVKERRNCIKPNKNFLNQLETYRGMLDAMKNKEKLQRSKSETNLKSTKDARLLPGSEPTPLIQALNHSKSKSGGDANEIERVAVDSASINAPNLRDTYKMRSVGGSGLERFVRRRSSSTSPRSIKSQNCSALVMKQQSQSLENLTPERSIADEPKNVRFPGSNGENYSVTQNQVLHIQKHIPHRLQISLAPVTSVRTIVHGLEAYQLQDLRKSTDDRKSLMLSFGRLDDDSSKSIERRLSASTKRLSSPVWTSSAKLITQTSNIARNSVLFTKEESKYKRQHSRKTQSWAATSGGITMDAFTLGSNSSIDSVSTHSSAPAATTFEVCVRTRQRPRELPSRHASWGSGDNKCGVPARNSSWAAYDSNRNNCQCTTSNQTNANAIFEGQIHELNVNNKTASADSRPYQNNQQHHLGTVRRTKQKLEECSILKKLCRENGVTSKEFSTHPTEISCDCITSKRNANLFRSISAVTSRTRYKQRCSSEEIVHGDTPALLAGRRSDGNRPVNAELFSASVPNSYTMSDIENKNTLSSSGTASDEENVILRSISTVKEGHHVSGNVRILKKSFEAKAICGLTGSASPTASVTAAGSEIYNKVTKSHQSLPSSPVAQHTNYLEQHRNEQATISQQSTKSSFLGDTVGVQAISSTKGTKAPLISSGAEDYTDHNVKGLVHKYQTSAESKNQTRSNNPSSSQAGVVTAAAFKPRPRSYYESQRPLIGKPHEFNESRPPPRPIKTANTISDGIIMQPPSSQQRRLQQHGKTHPLARLSLPKQTFNAAAYNTM
ncbi:protein phosphatase Slingshot isoform 1-T2 [Glossina fuscipes fuscipes]